MKLIGITGRAGSGKDTVAAYMCANYGFESLAFADPIRAGMRAIVGLEDYQFSHPHKEVVLEEFGKSPRQMMQALGTDWARSLVHQDFWIILAGKEISSLQDDYIEVVVTDVRFENEAEFLRNKGGEIWHINREGAGTPHSHASEAGIQRKPEDKVLDNNSSLYALFRQVDNLLVEP